MALLDFRADAAFHLTHLVVQRLHHLQLWQHTLFQRRNRVPQSTILFLPVRPLNGECAHVVPPLLLVLRDAGLDVAPALVAQLPQHLQRGLLLEPPRVGLLEQRVLQRDDVLHTAPDDAAHPGDLLLQGAVLLGPRLDQLLGGHELGADLAEERDAELRLGVQVVIDLLEALFDGVGQTLPGPSLLGGLGLGILEEALHLDDHPPRVGLQIPELLLDDAQLLRERARLLADELPLDRQQLSLLLVVELHLPVPLSLPPVQCGDARGVLGRGHRLLGGHPAAQRDARARDGQGRRQGRRFRCGGPWLWRRVRHPAPRRRLERLPQRLPQRLE
mmetsp:Transcript_61214/g.186873  ORF Transcript_61214/g.186873 Transcript_61214/m.186873 type:complete len:331 (+) Transcript_61214:761-1753(+)